MIAIARRRHDLLWCDRGRFQCSLRFRKDSRGVSLVEFMVVLAILATLLGLLLPAVQSARERARELMCKNNIDQLNKGLVHYIEVHKQLPKPPQPNAISGWMVEVLPFVEQKNLYERLPLDGPIAQLPDLAYRPPMIFRCPRRESLDRQQDGEIFFGHYVLATTNRRNHFSLFDAPIDLQTRWALSPELSTQQIRSRTGPHSGGYFSSQGFQQGVNRAD
ncbi:DUF1559 domain-containing protein [Pirellulaceae bacterium SH467]